MPQRKRMEFNQWRALSLNILVIVQIENASKKYANLKIRLIDCSRNPNIFNYAFVKVLHPVCNQHADSVPLSGVFEHKVIYSCSLFKISRVSYKTHDLVLIKIKKRPIDHLL